MHRANGSYLSFLQCFFFSRQKCFFNISSLLQENSWETNSSTFSLRLFIIKSHSGWVTVWDEVPAFTQPGTKEEESWEAPLLPFAQHPADLRLSPSTDLNQGTSLGSSQGCGAHRLAVTLADGAMESSAFLFLFKSFPVHKDWERQLSSPPPQAKFPVTCFPLCNPRAPLGTPQELQKEPSKSICMPHHESFQQRGWEQFTERRRLQEVTWKLAGAAPPWLNVNFAAAMETGLGREQEIFISGLNIPTL